MVAIGKVIKIFCMATAIQGAEVTRVRKHALRKSREPQSPVVSDSTWTVVLGVEVQADGQQDFNPEEGSRAMSSILIPYFPA